MTTAVEVGSDESFDSLRHDLRRARSGLSTIYRDGGQDIAVLIPAHAFVAVRKLIISAMTEFPLDCWGDPAIAVTADLSSGRVHPM